MYSPYICERDDPVSPFAFPANLLTDMTVDAAGNAVIVGKTYDEHFPATPGVVQTEYSAPVVGQGEGIRAKFDAFVAKLNTSGSAVMWATYFGTSGDDETLESVSTDSTGNLWLSGTTKPYRATEWHPPIECAVWRCGPPGGGPLGSSLIVGLDPSAARVLFSGVFAPGWGKVSRVDSSGLIHASGPSGLVSVFRPAVEISPRILGLTSGAGGEITGEIAPREIVSIYGTGIGPERPAGFMLDENGRVPTILSGVRVFFGDLPAPLLYASRNQIHAIVPNGVQPRSSVAVRVSSGLPPFTAQVFPSAPALFGDQDGHMVRNQDGFPNHAGNPAPAGSVVALWMTGTGADSQPDGTVASGPRDTKCCTAMYQQTPLEVHKLPNGTIALVGYGAADTAARIATGRGALKFRLQPSPREGESTLVSVPMWRVRRCKENSTRDGNGLELELLDPS